MKRTFDEYRRPETQLPKEMLSWQLYGAGLENLGQAGKPEAVAVPQCGPHELIMRVDAVGLCFSDTKVIKAGPAHPRLLGRDLRKDPTVLGHETAGTVVRVGDEIRDRFKIGERYVVQADCYYRGVTMAYGYVFRGGLSQYTLIPHQMIDGDEGTYLLPIAETTGYSQGALAEPWACVISAFNIAFRSHGKPGGVACILSSGTVKGVDFRGVYAKGDPGKAILVREAAGLQEAFRKACPSCRLTVQDDLPQDPVDDLFIVGSMDPGLVTEALKKLADHGVACLVGLSDRPLSVALDVGRVHYDRLSVIGTESSRVAGAYESPIRTKLLQGGKSWFIGAGGPMGRMHVQHALELAGGPSTIVATEVSQERLDDLVSSYADLAREKDIELIGLNPVALGQEGFSEKLKAIAPAGFDDIVVLAPVPRLIEGGLPFAGPNAVLNIFAGLSRGTTIQIDLRPFAKENGLRAMGSSGSRINEMATMLRRTESGEMDTNRSVAAISGMHGAWQGLKAVFDNVYPGKIVVYPQVTDIGLVSLADLQGIDPVVAARLRDGRSWTVEAEKEFLIRHTD